MRRRFVLLTLTFVAAVAEGNSPCVDVTLSDSLDQAKVVVLAKVVSSTPTDYRGRLATPKVAVRALYRVRPIEEVKGKRLREYRLVGDPPHTAGAASSFAYSGMPLTVGQTYLIFATGESLTVNPCASLAVSDADDALRHLRLLPERAIRSSPNDERSNKSRCS